MMNAELGLWRWLLRRCSHIHHSAFIIHHLDAGSEFAVSGFSGLGRRLERRG
jgi:hypothetical protein